VCHKESNAQFVAALHFDAERIDRFGPHGVVDGGKVDQVRIVGDDFVLEAKALGMVAEIADSIGGERFGGPLLLVFGEDLDAVEAEALGVK
jgi:hypothetical protein